MVPLLEKMLAAESPKERIAAAVALATLGKAPEALPILLKTVRDNPDMMAPAAKVLTWLTWDERLKTFRALRPLASTTTAFSELIGGMSRVSDPRAADVYWELLADPKIEEEMVQGLGYSLITAYSDASYISSDIPAETRRRIVAGAKPRAISGTDWQRRTALAVLAYADRDEAAATAMKLAADARLSDAVRSEAFQVQLLTQSETEATQAALAELRAAAMPRKKIALAYLAQGPKDFRSAASSRHWWFMNLGSSYSGTSNQPIVPEPPRGLKPADVRGLVKDADAETAAYAGYLAVLLGDREGIAPLLKYWRAEKRNSEQVTRLVYRAIAVLDDPGYISVLRDIFAKLDKYDLQEFYWTIRIMSGAEILEFRKQVRDAMKKSQLF